MTIDGQQLRILALTRLTVQLAGSHLGGDMHLVQLVAGADTSKRVDPTKIGGGGKRVVVDQKVAQTRLSETL